VQPKAPATPTAADKFPFPGENPGTPDAPAGQTAAPAAAGADKFPFQGETPAAPDAPQTGKPAKAFPFPGEPDAPASSSSSSSSSSSDGASDAAPDPNAPRLKDAGSTGSTRFQRRKMAVPEDADKRELDDLDVSHYYITTGNFTGAYMRAQDAVKLYPDDEQAHFALAVAAEKMKKLDEAVAEYTKYLALAPDGEKSKQARRTLESLQAK